MSRPTIMTPETLAKLRQAFLLGADDRSACLYADIGTTALYDYQKQNPEYPEQKRSLKNYNKLQALKKISNEIPNDVKVAQWWLERTCKKEFGLRAVGTDKQGLFKNCIPGELTDKEAEEINLMIEEQIKQMNGDGSPKVSLGLQ